jgi:hypothetical protein
MSEDLRLDGHVQRGGGLVGDQQRRVAGHGQRDHHALAHAARELVRVFVQALRGGRDLHQLQHAQGVGQRGLAVQAHVQAHRLGDLLADGEDRVQAGHGLLEDHRDFIAAYAPHFGLGQRQQIQRLAGAVGEHRLAADLGGCRARQQAHQREAGHRLAGAGLADQRGGLAGADAEAHVGDRADQAFVGVEEGAQVAHVEACAGWEGGVGEFMGCRFLSKRT